MNILNLKFSENYFLLAQGYDDSENSKGDVYSIQIFYDPNVVIPNGDFTEPDFADNDIEYDSEGKVTSFLNNPSNGDYLPKWTFSIGSPAEDHPKIDISPGFIKMYTTNSNSNGSGMNLKSSSISNFFTNTGKKIKIKFRINSFLGGECSPPYYEAPVKITIYINETPYLIAAFTNYSGSSAGGHLETYLDTGKDYEIDFEIPQTNLDGDPIPKNAPINFIQIDCHGWTWNVVIYSIAIY